MAAKASTKPSPRARDQPGWHRGGRQEARAARFPSGARIRSPGCGPGLRVKRRPCRRSPGRKQGGLGTGIWRMAKSSGIDSRNDDAATTPLAGPCGRRHRPAPVSRADERTHLRWGGRLCCTGGRMVKATRTCQWQGPVRAVDDNDDGRQMAVVLANPTQASCSAQWTSCNRCPEKPLNRIDSPLAWRPLAPAHLALAMDELPMTTWNPAESIHEFSIEQDQSPSEPPPSHGPPDGAMAAMGGSGWEDHVLIDALRRIEPRLPAYGHRGPVTSHALAKRGRERLLSVGADGTLRAWDDLRHSAQASSIETGWTAHGCRLPSVSWIRVAVLHGRGRSAPARRPHLADPVEPAHAAGDAPEDALHRGGAALAFSPDGEWLAAACPGRGWVAWHLKKGLRQTEAEQTKVQGVEWTADSRSLVIRHEEGWRSPATESRRLMRRSLIGGKGLNSPGRVESAER
jgi:hypothetical protein